MSYYLVPVSRNRTMQRVCFYQSINAVDTHLPGAIKGDTAKRSSANTNELLRGVSCIGPTYVRKSRWGSGKVGRYKLLYSTCNLKFSEENANGL